MRRNAQVREEARRLRTEECMALGDIAARLSIPKGTTYSWVKDIEIPRTVTEKQSENQRRGTMANQAKCLAIRQAAYATAYSEAKVLLSDRSIRDFTVLYLAEGYRKNRNSVALSNSNPKIIAFAHRCMRRLSTNEHFCYSFQYHADQDPLELQQYWASLLGIEPSIVHPIAKTNSGRLNGRRFACEYGVFQVQVSDTRFRAELQALMDAIQEEWAAR